MDAEIWGGTRQTGADAKKKRLIVAITGATGVVYGVRLLRATHGQPEMETHLVISNAGLLTLRHEMGLEAADLAPLVHAMHDVHDMGAPVASGSFQAEGMVIAPCSMKTLAAIANGISDNLIARAADVTLKERRRLVLLARETPLSLIHLRNMTAVTEAGGIVFPPMPSFYHQPWTIEQIVDHTVGRVLDVLGMPNDLVQRWAGLNQKEEVGPLT